MYDEVKKMVEENNLKLELYDYGIACRIKDTIYLNRHIFKYPNYCLEVVDHELRHTSEDRFKIKDFIMDLTEGSFIKNTKFMIMHPKSIFHLVPFGKYGDNYWYVIDNFIYRLGFGVNWINR